MAFDYRKFLAEREAKWLPVQDSGSPAGGLTLRVMELCGCEIRNVSRTVEIDCAKHRLKERLLLVPVAVAATMDFSALNPARVRRGFVDKKSGAEFVPILLSQTRPRLVHKGARPAQPAPPVEINPELVFVGNGVCRCDDNQPIFITPVGDTRPPTEDDMAANFVRIRRSNPHSLFVYGQVVSQLDLLRENQRLARESTREDILKWGFIYAQPFKHENPRQIIPDVVPAQAAPSQFALPPEWIEEEKRKMREEMEKF